MKSPKYPIEAKLCGDGYRCYLDKEKYPGSRPEFQVNGNCVNK